MSDQFSYFDRTIRNRMYPCRTSSINCDEACIFVKKVVVRKVYFLYILKHLRVFEGYVFGDIRKYSDIVARVLEMF